MKKFLIGVILFSISVIAFVPLAIWGIIETVIGLFYKRKFFKSLAIFGDVFKSVAILIDMMLNVLLQFPANRILQYEGYKFGKYKDTISRALGINERDKTLTKNGLRLCNFLNFIDTNHCKNSI